MSRGLAPPGCGRGTVTPRRKRSGFGRGAWSPFGGGGGPVWRAGPEQPLGTAEHAHHAHASGFTHEPRSDGAYLWARPASAQVHRKRCVPVASVLRATEAFGEKRPCVQASARASQSVPIKTPGEKKPPKRTLKRTDDWLTRLGPIPLKAASCLSCRGLFLGGLRPEYVLKYTAIIYL